MPKTDTNENAAIILNNSADLRWINIFISLHYILIGIIMTFIVQLNTMLVEYSIMGTS